MTRRGRARPLHGAVSHPTEAIVTRINDFAESSAVVVLLTRDHGLVHALAKGAKRVANSFLGPLDKGVLYQVRLGTRAGEGLVTLYSASAREAFPAVRTHPRRFCAAATVLEVATDLLREGEPNEELFRLTAYALKVIDRAPAERIELVTALFLARAIALSGHVPETGICVACGRGMPRTARPLLSPRRGGLLHPSCAMGEAMGEAGARGVSTGALDLLEALWSRTAADAVAMDVEKPALRELRLALVFWLEQTLDRRFKAALALEGEFVGRAEASG